MAPQYTRGLIFNNRFRASEKGSSRETICSLDWNPQCSEFDEMVAFASTGRIRVFGREAKIWKMLMNRRPPGANEVNTLKWSPLIESCLAVAIGDGHLVTIDLLNLESGDFRSIKKFQVPNAGAVSSLSWDCTGICLIASVKLDEDYSEARMILIKKQGRRFIQKVINCGYEAEFTSVFHPTRLWILSASVTSKDIDVWSEDKFSFDWHVMCKVSCEQGITNMCFSNEATYLAAIVAGRLMIWLYCDDDGDEHSSHPRLEEVKYEDDDGFERKKGHSLATHCDNIISLNWSSELFLLTGSSMGTFCIHAPSVSTETNIPLKSPFNVLYFRWGYVHAYNEEGPVSCVSWTRKSGRMAVAGNDGVVIVWDLVSLDVANHHKRNYVKEYSYFVPGNGRYEPGIGGDDVASIESIPLSESSEVEASGAEETDEEDAAKTRETVEADDISEGNRSVGIKDASEADGTVDRTDSSETGASVHEDEDDMKAAITKLTKSVQDALDQLKLLGDHMKVVVGTVTEHDGNLSDLLTFGNDNEQNIENKVIPRLMTLVAASEVIKTELTSALKEVVLPRLSQLEEEMLGQKKEMIEEVVLPRLSQLEEVILGQKKEMIEEVVLPRLSQLEEVMSGQKKEMIAAVQEVLQKPKEHEEMTNFVNQEIGKKIQSRLDRMEQQILVKHNLVEERFGRKHNQILSRLNEMEESNLVRKNEMECSNMLLTQKIDRVIDMLEESSHRRR